ncbi:transcription antitermination factor NusB [Candidatus Microthrix sp.]|uniref:transcription antitermination factor NusB n=1 Tax=Candidatus Neomicrothrix sp. TaxID=2719034 RepID=UPI0016A85345|nr:transcription antitermination factor NusB [Candidatus Microthrix sp.]NLH65359.1 transcription antitermination factor NusB [Candidatus Microthrix parvicella]MBK6502840.1 transcription antitermination factor NusB [Candidatus Microthrix sp.]MBK7021355.1 transcription antitermination factor NusB [Candidatus Microthrix sp.]MBK7324368.1 transcription antitermination factor NusB [Candidatus Microthrix sp.]MBL0205007.1 transcription antitermination factor NusB [Candidatus Microthrix sp.]
MSTSPVRDGARHDSAPIIGGRREAREQALLLLYEAEIRDLTPEAMVDEVVVEPEAYTLEVLAGVTLHRTGLDELLTGRTGDWPLHRLASIDRAVLRLAAWELTEREDVPTAVILNEAVELAKTYGTDDSGGFVNGVLANLAAEVRPDTLPVEAPDTDG